MDAAPGPEVGVGRLHTILDWLRRGYPEGVPPRDYIPLVALLRPRLTDDELNRILSILTDTGALPAERSDIGAAITDVIHHPPTEEDISTVAARLAAAGWPLQSSAIGRPVTAPHRRRPSFLASVASWLRQGYPTGVPEQDYVPLFALLRRRLSDQEVEWVVDELVAEGNSPLDRIDVAAMITRVTDELPSDSDLGRVRDRLVAVGWDVEAASPPN